MDQKDKLQEAEKEKAENRLIKSFARWQHLYEFGGTDPFYEDGVNLNLARNQILAARKDLEDLGYFPAVYNQEVPPVVDNKYMARADEIREHARESITAYKYDENYLYLITNSGKISKKAADEICLGYVLGYVRSLEEFINHDDLVKMRRHERPDIYLDSFLSCRKKMEEILSEQRQDNNLQIFEETDGQLNFFKAEVLL